jgi:phosphate transport system substrate-binding protein
MRRLGRHVVVAGVLALVALSAAAPAAHAGGAAVLGGGSGFAALEIDQWRGDTARSPFNLVVNYQAQGSTFGRLQFAGGSLDFGASDIPYLEQEAPSLQNGRCKGKPADNRCFVYVPISAGGLAFMYNLVDGSGRRINNLKLTRSAVCKIFTGAITKWNDPEIAATNPQLESYDHTIKQVVRSDGAGESYVFSEFCLAVAPGAWRAFIDQQRNGGDGNHEDPPEFYAGQPTSNWPPNGWGNVNPVNTADGTANFVADPNGGPDSITYVAAGYAKVRSFPTASVQNAAGLFTQPDETNVTVALAYATGRPNGTFKLRFDGPDPRAYFPSTYSYILGQTTGFDPGKGATISRFLCYAVTKGQVIAPNLRYARLSQQLVDIAIGAIVQIPGAPSRAACPVAGAPPPPLPIQVCTRNCGQATAGLTPGGTNSGGAAGDGGSSNGATSGGSGKDGTPTATTVKGTSPGGGSAVVDVGSATTSTTESGDAVLASATRPETAGKDSDSSTIWVLLAGACAMLATTTFVGRRRTAS